MRKILSILLFTVFTIGVANAQRRTTVSGVVADSDTRQPLIGVVISISPASDSTAVNTILTGAGGAFSTGVAVGPNDFNTTHMGYTPDRRRIEVGTSRLPLDTIYLRQGIEIDEIVMTAVAMRTSTKGDTIIFNADSYKVAEDAMVSDLLKKLPGVKIEGGSVEAQGEAVRKILIDGKEFFGDDVSAAIASLPAEAVKNMELFDKLSDNAEFTGIDDGEGYKAINITTRESMRQGVMGQVSAQYGVEPPDGGADSWRHYGLAGGNVNIFRGDSRLTVGGTINNLNERSFTANDMLGAGGGEGLGKVANVRLNYTDMWGEKDQWRFESSYSYNTASSEDHSQSEREYFEDEDAIYRNSASISDRYSRNQNHQLNARIDFKPNSFHELRIRPNISYQGNSQERTGSSIYYPADMSLEDIMLENWNNSNGTALRTGLQMNYRVRLGKPGRTLSVFFNGNYNSRDRGGENYSERQDGTPRQQRTPSYSYDYSLNGGLTFTEPISDASLINLDYSINYGYSDQDRKSYLYDFLEGRYMDDYDIELSGVYNSGYLTHRVGPGYRMQRGGTTLSASVNYQHSSLESTRVLPYEFDLKTGFDNITYSVMLTSRSEKNRSSVRVRLNSSTRNPSVDNLQDVVDISNVQNIYKGNPALKPSYNNNIFAQYIIPWVDKGRTLSFNLNGSYTTNSIVNRTISESPGYPVLDSGGDLVETLDAVGRFSEPVNMNGEWSARAGIGYGFPVSFLKSNVNLDVNLSYRESPSQLGKWRGGEVEWTTNRMRNLAPGANVTIGSNISENVDFYISYGLSYNNTRNTSFERSNSEYLRQMLRANFRFVLPLDFTVTGNFSYMNDNSISGSRLDREFFIANAGIGKKIFRSRRGEVSIFVNDIFNQNVSFNRHVSPQYIETSTQMIIGRYAGIRFTWNIRKFGSNASQNIDNYDLGGGDRQRQQGPPQGGGRQNFQGGGGNVSFGSRR